MFLLDEAGERTQSYGEIAIRTAYHTLGYWRRPELTQAVFLPDPEGGNRRIYRTGDLGLLRSDGIWELKSLAPCQANPDRVAIWLLNSPPYK